MMVDDSAQRQGFAKNFFCDDDVFEFVLAGW